MSKPVFVAIALLGGALLTPAAHAAGPCDPILLGQLDSASFGSWDAGVPEFDTPPGSRYAYAAARSPGVFFVIDLQGASGAEIVASPVLPFDTPTGVAAVDEQTLLVCGFDSNLSEPGWIVQYDLTDPASPAIVSQVLTESRPRDLEIAGTLAVATVRSEPDLEEFEGVSLFRVTPAGPEPIETLNVPNAGAELEVGARAGQPDIVFTSRGSTLTAIDIATPEAPAVLATFGLAFAPGGFDVAGTTVYVGTASCAAGGSGCGVLAVDFGPAGDAPAPQPIIRTPGGTDVVVVTPQNAEVVVRDETSIAEVGAYVFDLTNSDLGPLRTGQTGMPLSGGGVAFDGEGVRFVMAERTGVVRFYDVVACAFPPPQIRIGGQIEIIGSSAYNPPGGNQVPLDPQANVDARSGPDNQLRASGSTGSGGVRTNIATDVALDTSTRGLGEGVSTLTIDAWSRSVGECYNPAYFSAASADTSFALVVSREYEVLEFLDDPGVSSSIGFGPLSRGVYPISLSVGSSIDGPTEDEVFWSLKIEPADAGPAPAPRASGTAMPLRFETQTGLYVDLTAETFDDFQSAPNQYAMTPAGIAPAGTCASTYDGAEACGSWSASIEPSGESYVVRLSLGSDLSKTANCRYDLRSASTLFEPFDNVYGSGGVVFELDRVFRVEGESSSAASGQRDFRLFRVDTGDLVTGDVLAPGAYAIRFFLNHSVDTSDITQSTTSFMRSYAYQLVLTPVETAAFRAGWLGIVGQASGNGVSDSAEVSQPAAAKAASVSGSTGSGGVRGDAAAAAFIVETDAAAALRVVGTTFAIAEPGSDANISVDNTDWSGSQDEEPLELELFRTVTYQITDDSDGGSVVMRDASNGVVPLSGTLAPGLYRLTVSAASFAAADGGAAFAEVQASQIDWVLSMAVPRCPADVSGDGVLNFDDIDAFVTAFLAGDAAADVDASGTLNFDDIDAFAAGFMSGCSP